MSYRFLYLSPTLDAGAVVDDGRLAPTFERHTLALERPAFEPLTDPRGAFAREPEIAGAVIEMWLGWPSRQQLRFAANVLAQRRRVWLYWPNEQAIECLDRERIASGWRHWLVSSAFMAVARPVRRFAAAAEMPDSAVRRRLGGKLPREWRMTLRARLAIAALRGRAAPVPFPQRRPPSAASPLSGTGLYLRLDYWSPLDSGGSYGHTCYVAKELAAVTERFQCLMANRFSLLDELGIAQQVLPLPIARDSEENMMASASRHYAPLLRELVASQRPAYIYERLVLGSYAGAQLSQELQIPYIVEYNGSEISIRSSFSRTRYIHEDVYLKSEMLAFEQATMISVVSAAIKASLVARGIPAGKILVNPNGADLTSYAPAAPADKRALRHELGFADGDRVVGFSGTFGGWHGVDVLAAGIPRVCAGDASTKFLLIGDGAYKHLVDESIEANGLQGRVRFAGRVPQHAGARLLQACDIFVSPHSSHMIDGKFFGSPTKLFEYMAVAGGIVASDLEQIGEVLSPAFRPAELIQTGKAATSERAVLCTPGSVEEFVDGVLALVRRPDLCDTLGRNARQAVVDEYSWARHVARLWDFAAQIPAVKPRRGRLWLNVAGRLFAPSAIARPTAAVHREPEPARARTSPDSLAANVGLASAKRARTLRIGGTASAVSPTLSMSGADGLPFQDEVFDVVYSDGVLERATDARYVVDEIRRVLKPGGGVIVTADAEQSWRYWHQTVWQKGLMGNMLETYSPGAIMSGATVYTPKRLAGLFQRFDSAVVRRRFAAGRLVMKATKPRA